MSGKKNLVQETEVQSLVTTVLGGREIFLLLLDGPRVPDLGALLVTPDVPGLGKPAYDNGGDTDTDEDSVTLVVVGEQNIQG